MSSKSASIGGKLLLDRRGFTAGLNASVTDLRQAVGTMERTPAPRLAWGQRMFGGATEIYSSLKMVQGAARVTAGAVDEVFQASANREDVIRSLAATSDGMRSVEEQYERLEAMSVKAGVATNDMVRGFVQLRGAAVSAEDAEKTANAVANALKRVGKSADFGAVMTNMVQITSRVTGLGDEIKETANYLPEIRQLSRLKFGTDSGEGLNEKGITGKQWVEGMTDELSKYKAAAGGARAASMGLSSAWENMKVAIGDVVNEPISAAMNQIAQDFRDIKKVNELGEDLAPKEKKAALSEAELAAKREEAAAQQKKLDDARIAAAQEIFDREAKIRELMADAAKAEKTGDEDAIRAAQTKLELAKSLDKVMRETGANKDQATQAIEKQIAAELELERIKAMSKPKDRQSVMDELQISSLKAKGKNRQAEKLEGDVKERRSRDELIKQGFSEDEATNISKQQRQNAEDEDRFAKTGRRRIRRSGRSNSKTEFGGLGDPFADAAITADTFDQNMPKNQKMRSNRSNQNNSFGEKATQTQNGATDDTRFAAQGFKEVVRAVNELKEAVQNNSPAVADKIKSNRPAKS